MKKRLVFLVFLILLIGVGIFVYRGQQKAQNNSLYYSGTIEATEAQLSFQVTGRVTRVFVDEGATVAEGAALAELERSEYETRYHQAQANLATADVTITKLETVLDMYEKTLPAEVARAEAALASARAVFREAAKNRERYETLARENVVSEQEWEAVHLNAETAHARLREMEARLHQAKSNLKQIDTTRKEIAVARAQKQALAPALDLAEIQLSHTTLKAPFAGIVTSRNVEPGEVITPGREVLTLSDLSTVELKIFVGEREIGAVRPGQDVTVQIDTYPDKKFRGKVSFISTEGEFTPKVIQTHKERVKLVYLVKVSIPNPDMTLKPGMPADGWIQ